MSVRRRWIALLTVMLLLAGILTPIQAAEGPPLEGESFPNLTFPAPQKLEEAQYLGLKEREPFRVATVKAEILILEVFSMYCPFCQKEAPVVNGLFDAIKKRGLEKKIKIIGLGAGNSTFEVNAFRQLYHIAFPLLPDPDYVLHRALGHVRTPYFIVLRTAKKGSPLVIYSQVGGFGDPQEFLDLVLERSRKKKGK